MNPASTTWDSDANGLIQFEPDGFQIIQRAVRLDECELLSSELTPLFEQQQAVNGGKIGGVRNLLRNNLRVAKFARAANILSLIEQFTKVPVFPVRAIFFDKNPQANWLVPWHQDLAIAVTERIETPGFNAWSVKEGVPHVQPPQEILEGMLTLRLHLDDCRAQNGALHVMRGSHQRGKLTASEISRCVAENEALVCSLSKGDALLMRPLLLHASWPAETPAHRRVLHVEYATQNLPNGLKWFGA